MLVITENATEVIRAIVDRPELPGDAGIRIADTGSDQGLSVTAAELPEEGDAVIEHEGARVFLESTAATALDDKVLDAAVDPQGGVQFKIAPQ